MQASVWVDTFRGNLWLQLISDQERAMETNLCVPRGGPRWYLVPVDVVNSDHQFTSYRWTPVADELDSVLWDWLGCVREAPEQMKGPEHPGGRAGRMQWWGRIKKSPLLASRRHPQITGTSSMRPWPLLCASADKDRECCTIRGGREMQKLFSTFSVILHTFLNHHTGWSRYLCTSYLPNVISTWDLGNRTLWVLKCMRLGDNGSVI